MIHTVLPVPYKDPEVEAYAAVFETFPEPDCTPLTYKPVCFFTDGSCHLPQDRTHRWASYAIVCTHHQLHDLPVDKLEDAPWLLNCFDTLAASHVTGKQNIARAELMAAVIAHELELGIPVVTDSQYVISAHAAVENTPHSWKFHKKKNYDLLKRLHVLHWEKRRDIPVRKVRAHQSIYPQDADAFEKVGNRVADCAANLTQKYLAKPVTQALTKLSQECSHSKSILTQHYQMRYELAELRKRLDSEAVTHVVADTKEQRFIDYHVSNPVMYTIPANLFELVHASRWGSLYSDLLLRWLQTLQWPRQPDRRKPAVGITWLELACNFMVTTQHTIPINTAERGQQACYRWVEDDITFDNRSFSFTLATNSFRDSIEHLQYLLQVDVLPTMRPQKVTAIRQMGGNATKQGIPYRPMMEYQAQTIRMLTEYFKQQNGSRSFDTWPTVPRQEPCVLSHVTLPPGDTQAARMRRYHIRRKQIKQTQQRWDELTLWYVGINQTCLVSYSWFPSSLFCCCAWLGPISHLCRSVVRFLFNFFHSGPWTCPPLAAAGGWHDRTEACGLKFQWHCPPSLGRAPGENWKKLSIGSMSRFLEVFTIIYHR